MALDKDKLHIDAPQLLPRRRRIGDALATGIMWALYSYLWAPLISLVAWLLGFEFAYDVMIRAGGYETLKEVLFFYAFMVACIFVVVSGWSTMNRRRFAGRDRRKAVDPVTDAEIVAHFDIQEEYLTALRDSRVSLVYLDGAGQIERVEAGMSNIPESSARIVGPEGAIADNEASNDGEKDDAVIQRST